MLVVLELSEAEVGPDDSALCEFALDIVALHLHLNTQEPYRHLILLNPPDRLSKLLGRTELHHGIHTTKSSSYHEDPVEAATSLARHLWPEQCWAD